MERRTPLFVVCSPRPRVGKTLVARLLTEFVIANRRRALAFDVNPDEFTLAEHLPRHTAAIGNLTDTRGQVALFDALVVNDETVKIVDLGAPSFQRFFAVMQEIAFVQEARHRAIQPVVLFITDPDRRAVQGYADLQRRWRDLALVPVHNEGVMRAQPPAGGFPPRRAGGVPVRIQQLPPFLKGLIEKRGFTFTGFLNRPAESETPLHAWIKRAFLEFRELELRLLMEDLKSTLSFSADG